MKITVLRPVPIRANERVLMKMNIRGFSIYYTATCLKLDKNNDHIK